MYQKYYKSGIGMTLRWCSSGEQILKCERRH